MYSIDLPENSIYGALRKDIIADLIGNGIPSSAAGNIVNFYDPRHDEYLDRVGAWQVLLCTSTCSSRELIPVCFSENRWVVPSSDPSVFVLNMPPWIIDQINGVVQLVYKYKGKARKEMDMEAVKTRLRRPGVPVLTQVEIEAARQSLSRLQPPSSWDSLLGKYGPGSTSDRLDIVERWSWKGKIPVSVPLVVYPIRQLEVWQAQNWPDELYERYGVTRIALVPKSIKTDRTVSSEPAARMFCQKCVGDYMRRQLITKLHGECNLHDRFLHNSLLQSYDTYTESVMDPITRKSKTVTRHDVYTSIDLSDASDHVSRRLVQLLLPNWKDYLFSVRSTFAKFPDGEIVPLRTFAPMGSDVCFPVLTAVCYALAKSICGRSKIGVFGDDIIVPLRYFDAVCDVLSRAGLVVNCKKSGTTGRYTESCGQEFYRIQALFDAPSFEVTATKIRKPLSKVDGATLNKWFRNWNRMNWVHVEERVWKLAKACTRVRWNAELQRLEVLTRHEVVPLQGTNLSGYHGLIRWFCQRSQRDEDQAYDIYTPSGRTRLEPVWLPVQDLPHLTRFITQLDVK